MSAGLGASGVLELLVGGVLGLGLGLVVGIALIALLSSALERHARARRVASAAALPDPRRPDLIVVLGCPPRARDGRPNRHLTGRARAAAEAFHALGSVPLLCSGRGLEGASERDEVEALAALLAEAGVPPTALRFDRAARRTIDTIDHLAAHHADARILLVTQAFHLPRTLFLARTRGLDVWGLAAPGPEPGWRGRLREGLGQLRAIADVARSRRSR
ncbi:MAG: ElyC/SanA/YdcF family protein [Myxococcota bacterium]